MYKTKTNDQGQIELWYEGENVRTLLGVYDSQEELDQAIEMMEWVTKEMGKEILTYQEISPGALPREVKITATHKEWGRLLGLMYKKQHGPLKRSPWSPIKSPWSLVNITIVFSEYPSFDKDDNI